MTHVQYGQILWEVQSLRSWQAPPFGSLKNGPSSCYTLSLLQPLDLYRSPSAIGSAIGRPDLWKSRFWYRYRPEGMFRNFRPGSGPPPPPGTRASTAKKVNSLAPAMFSPLHGLFGKRGGTGTGIRVSFPCISPNLASEHSCRSSQPPRSKPLRGLSRAIVVLQCQNPL